MAHTRFVVLVLGAAMALTAVIALQGTPGVPQLAPMPSTPAGKCLYLADAPLDRDDKEALRMQLDAWVATCREATAADPANSKLKVALSRAYWHAVGREASLAPMREAIVQGDTEAMLDLFNDFNSFDRHLDRPDLIPRDEAERALRRAAELGNAEAIWRLATIKSRGGPFKHDMVEARKWGERAVANPPKEVGAGLVRLVVGHWLSLSDDADQRKRGIALLESLGERADAQAYLGEALRKDDPVKARALLEGAVRREPGRLFGAVRRDAAQRRGRPEGREARPRVAARGAL